MYGYDVSQVCAVRVSSSKHNHNVLLCGSLQRMDGLEFA